MILYRVMSLEEFEAYKAGKTIRARNGDTVSKSLNCYACPQGDVVKDCPRRKMFHRLGLQVHALRENPAPGECEFRYENEQRAVTPQYQAISKEVIDQLP